MCVRKICHFEPHFSSLLNRTEYLKCEFAIIPSSQKLLRQLIVPISDTVYSSAIQTREAITETIIEHKLPPLSYVHGTAHFTKRTTMKFPNGPRRSELQQSRRDMESVE